MYYDFQCQTCKHIFEKQKSMHDASNEKCPKCSKEALRVISGGAGILAGGLSKTPSSCSGSPVSCPSAHKCGMGCMH